MTDGRGRLDMRRLHTHLARHIPDLGSDLRVELIEGGRSNLTYLVSDGSTTWALRRPPFGTIAESANDIHREYRITRALARSPVTVAKPVLYCDDPTVIGAPFSLAEWVEGTVFRSPEQLAALDGPAVRKLADAMMDLLLLLHRLPPEEVGLHDFGRPHGYLARQVNRWKQQWETVATRDSPAADELHRRLAAEVPEQQRTGIVHGDFRLDNIIFMPDELRVAALLDWEMATIGDPLADLGLLLVYCDPVCSDVLPHGCPVTGNDSFPTREEIIASYGEGTDRDLENLPFYEALGYYKLAVIAEGIHRRFLEGMTVGAGFDTVGRAVPGLLDAGLSRASEIGKMSG